MGSQKQNIVFINANVLTMEEKSAPATAVAVRGKYIVCVGSNEEALACGGQKAMVIDAKGRLLMPGFIESHMHPMMYAHDMLGVDCTGEVTYSLESVLSALQEKVQNTPKGQWIKGAGWDDSKFKEKRNPTRWDLDKVSPDHPVMLMRTCVHVVVANSMALKMANIDKNTPDPEGGHIQKDPETGEPTGILQERAMEMLPIPSYSLEQLKDGLKMGLKNIAERGITCIGDMAGQPVGLKIYQQLYKEQQLSVRFRLWMIANKTIIGEGTLDDLTKVGVESGFGNEMISIQGVKYVLDGSVSGRTAAVTEPYYKNASAHGIIYCEDQGAMIESVRKAFQSGLRASIHAIGDRAIDFALDVFEKSSEGMDFVSMRNRMEHCILPRMDQLERIKKLGIIIGSSFGFIYPLGEGYLNALGPERVKKAIPQKSYEEMGIIAPGNTDCPVCDLNPLLAIYGVVMRKSFAGNSLGEEQRVSVMEAIKSYTTYPAYSTFEEDKIGTIKEGKLADLVVLNENILEIDPEKIKDVNVDLTMMNGEIVWDRGN